MRPYGYNLLKKIFLEVRFFVCASPAPCMVELMRQKQQAMNSISRLRYQCCKVFLGVALLCPGYKVILAQPSEPLERDKSYTLALPNGSVLHEAVFRDQRGNAYVFDIPGVGKNLSLTDFRVVPEPTPRPWLASAGVSAAFPLNQRKLGFQQGIAGDLQFAIQVWPRPAAWLPWLAVRAGFLRLDGERALLSGPELSVGPAWLVPLTKRANHFLYTDLTTGAGFYSLLNEKIKRTYRQHTFIGQGHIGYLFRHGQWGVLLSWAQQFVYDVHYPLVTGGVRVAAVFHR